MEIWKDIEGFPDYQISSLGRVKSLKTGKGTRRKKGDPPCILNPSLNPDGYPIVNIGKVVRVHRLVASAFLPKIDGKDEVDHINRICSDNSVENLRWVSRTEQVLNTSRQQHEYKNIGFRVKISRKDIGYKFDKTFHTLEEAIAVRDQELKKVDSLLAQRGIFVLKNSLVQ